jgi:hypothetical protein
MEVAVQYCVHRVADYWVVLFLILFYKFVFEVLSRRGVLVIDGVGVMQRGDRRHLLYSH